LETEIQEAIEFYGSVLLAAHSSTHRLTILEILGSSKRSEMIIWTASGNLDGASAGFDDFRDSIQDFEDDDDEEEEEEGDKEPVDPLEEQEQEEEEEEEEEEQEGAKIDLLERLKSNSSEQEIPTSLRDLNASNSKKIEGESVEVALTPPTASVVRQEEAVVPSASLIQTKAAPPKVDEFVPSQPPLAETPTSTAKEAVPPHVVASTKLPSTALSTAASVLSSIPPIPAPSPMLLSSSTETAGSGDSSVKNRASMFAFMPRKNPAYAEPVEGSFFSLSLCVYLSLDHHRSCLLFE
jgi:hypothetical protein